MNALDQSRAHVMGTYDRLLHLRHVAPLAAPMLDRVLRDMVVSCGDTFPNDRLLASFAVRIKFNRYAALVEKAYQGTWSH